MDVAPLAVDPVVLWVAVPVVARLAPAVDADEVDDADVPVEWDVVLFSSVAAVLFGVVVILLLEPAIVMLLDVPVGALCVLVEFVVWAWTRSH